MLRPLHFPPHSECLSVRDKDTDMDASQTLDYIDAQHWDADGSDPKPWNRFGCWNRDVRRRFAQKAKGFKFRHWDTKPRFRSTVGVIKTLLLVLCLALLLTFVIWGVGALLSMISPVLTLAWYFVLLFGMMISPVVVSGRSIRY